MVGREDIRALRQAVVAIESSGPARPRNRFALGAAGVDDILGGGLCRGALHEVIARKQNDAAAAFGFAAGLCLRASRAGHAAGLAGPEAALPRGQRIVWIRQEYGETESGKLFPPGLAAMGLAPEALVQLRLGNVGNVLRAGLESAACPALGAVAIEIWGAAPLLDLSATRRLLLAAEKSGVPVFLLRVAQSIPASAAATRWNVAPAPSRALEAGAPGATAFKAELSRHRGGADGLHWRMEWDSDTQSFTEAALSRPVVRAPADGPVAPPGAAGWRRAG